MEDGNNEEGKEMDHVNRKSPNLTSEVLIIIKYFPIYIYIYIINFYLFAYLLIYYII
jgi:hypothetical protein